MAKTHKYYSSIQALKNMLKKEKQKVDDIIRDYGLGEWNERGYILFYNEENLMVANTLLEFPEIRL